MKNIIRNNRSDSRIPLLETQIQDLLQKINKDSTYYGNVIANHRIHYKITISKQIGKPTALFGKKKYDDKGKSSFQ